MRRALSGAATGAAAGLALVDLEFAFRYLPALRDTDLPVQGSLALAAALIAAVLGALTGLVHRGLAYLALVGLALWFNDERLLPVVLALVGIGIAEAIRHRPLVGLTLLLPVLVALVQTRPAPPSAGPASGPPDIVLVVLDTVSARATSLYGATLDTTPTLERLATQATVFTQATSPAPWTVPSHASIFTGLMPRQTGCHHEHPALPKGIPTSAERLAAAGYRTGAFVANPWVGRFDGITRGFAFEESAWEAARAVQAFTALRLIPSSPSKGGRVMRDAALRWLDADPSRPAFVFINLLEAHSPFQDTPQADRYGVADPETVGARAHAVREGGPDSVPDYPRPGELDQDRKLYAAGIRAVDDIVGSLIEALQDRGRWDRTVLIVTADHGEAFGEHGFNGHMVGLHQETLHVPLVVRVPGQVAAVVDRPVSTTALYATVQKLAGLDVPGALPLASLGPAAQTQDAPILSEQLRPLQVRADRQRSSRDPTGIPNTDLGPLDYRATRARDARFAVLAEAPTDGSTVRWFLYDLVADPVEAHDLWAQRGALSLDDQAAVARLQAAVQPLLGPPQTQGQPLPMESDLRAQLEALGYMGGR
ncbi:MAG: sulfatase [Oligoflexia bacterium]|nr:sulfatase [Oligoflexia bacterium]